MPAFDRHATGVGENGKVWGRGKGQDRRGAAGVLKGEAARVGKAGGTEGLKGRRRWFGGKELYLSFAG